MELYKLEAKELLIEDDLGKDPRVFRKPLLSHAAVVKVKGDRIANTRSFIRHDSKKLAKAIEQIIKKK